MIIDKEYPATHSSDTAWFCVDLDGNVAVFDIEEDGPRPNDFEGQHCIADLMTECLPSHTEENIYDLPLTDAQIKPMLLPHCFEDDVWEDGYNYYWMDTIIKLDMKKYDVLLKVLAHRPGTNPIDHKPGLAVCFSRENGYFYLDLFDNKEGVWELKKANAILEIYTAPFHYSPYEDDYEDDEDEEDDDEMADMNLVPMEVELDPELVRTMGLSAATAIAYGVDPEELVYYDHLIVGNPTEMLGDFFTNMWANA